jgi:hypothetical protein
MDNFEEVAKEFIGLAKKKNYTKQAVEIIGTIVCSETASSLGYSSVEGLKLAKKYCDKYDDERDCINALVEIIK